MEALDLTLSGLLGILGYIGGVIGVFYTIRTFKENTKVKEGEFLMRKFEGFQRDRQAMLDNPKTLSLLAGLKGMSENEYILQSINSFRINKAFENYYLYNKGHIEQDVWERDRRDIQRLFSDESIVGRWQELKTLFPVDFQDFIEDVSPKTSSTMKLNVIHATQGCEDSSCPTVYQNETGDYVIQGFKIKPEDKQSIALPEGEDAIVVPKDFLESFVKKS